jgi:hypothetical protein
MIDYPCPRPFLAPGPSSDDEDDMSVAVIVPKHIPVCLIAAWPRGRADLTSSSANIDNYADPTA